MNREEILSIKQQTSLLCAEYGDEYKKHIKEKTDREFAYALFQKISDGKYYSVKINETLEIRDVEIRQIDAYIHQVHVMNMTYKPQPCLNWKERLKVLFTGHFPVGIGWE